MNKNALTLLARSLLVILAVFTTVLVVQRRPLVQELGRARKNWLISGWPSDLSDIARSDSTPFPVEGKKRCDTEWKSCGK